MAVQVFVAECGLSRVEVSRGCSSLQHMGFTRWWRLFLQAHRRPQLRHAGLVTPQHGPGKEPVSPAPVGGFLTTGPPGKCLNYFLSVFLPEGFLPWLPKRLPGRLSDST